MRPEVWKVGELAKRTGVSVRTLHYYDEIGLFTPSHHSASGYRLYTAADVARLQQIRSLRQLGLSLEEVRDCLNRPGISPLRVVRMHLDRLREQVRLQQRLCQRLEGIEAILSSAGEVSAEEFLQTIVEMSMLEKYYTPEQREYLKQRRQLVGEERIRQVEAEWPRLIEEVRAEMERGTDPASEAVQQLARRWAALVNEFTGGDPGIEQSLRTLYQQEDNVHGMDVGALRPLMAYVEKALAAAKQSE